MIKIGGIYIDSNNQKYMIPIRNINNYYFGIVNINEKNDNYGINLRLKNDLRLYCRKSFWMYKSKELEKMINGYIGQMNQDLLIRFDRLCELSTAYQAFINI